LPPRPAAPRARCRATPVDLSLSVAPLTDASGASAGSIAILADISDRKRREEEESETARFREQFVGIVGHDLRNPLTAIVTSARLLLHHGALSERQARVVRRIGSSADRMARMIDDLLDFARSRLGGGFPIHPRRVDLRELCEHAIGWRRTTSGRPFPPRCCRTSSSRAGAARARAGSAWGSSSRSRSCSPARQHLRHFEVGGGTRLSVTRHRRARYRMP
jgi:hypothetical protein